MNYSHTSSLVNNQLRVDDNASVVGPFSPRQEQHHNQGDDGDNTTAGGSDTCLIDRLREGIKPRESRLGGHRDGARSQGRSGSTSC